MMILRLTLNENFGFDKNCGKIVVPKFEENILPNNDPIIFYGNLDNE